MSDAMNLAKCPVADFDSWSEDQMAKPYALYEELRNRCPVGHSPHHGGFVFASNYDNAKEVLTNFKTFSSAQGMVLPPRPMRTYPADLDPPLQQRYRRVLTPALMPDAVESMRPRLEAIVEDLIDGFIDKGEADLGADFVRRALPPFILPFIGVPVEDEVMVRERLDVILRGRAGDPARMAKASEWIMDYLDQLIEKRRTSKPEVDALSTLIAALIEDEPMTNTVISGILLALLLGGLDTTTSVTLDSLYYLSNHPDEAEKLRSGLLEWPVAIEEFVRCFTPPTAIMRTVAKDNELAGVELKEGEYIVAMLGSANRDPNKFPDAEECQLDRADNPHIGFGAGAHVCIGKFLARMEIEVFLKAILRRMPDFKPKPGFSPEYFAASTRQMKSLPVVFTSGR